jgi:hypothetical protein
MNIINPTLYTVRKIHSFDVHNPDPQEHVLIDVIEPLGTAAGKIKVVAILHSVGYDGRSPFSGAGDSVEDALNDFLAKMSKIPWPQLLALTELPK